MHPGDEIGTHMGAVAQLRSRLGGLLAEIARFGTVGLMALVIDVGLFNLLRFAGDDSQGVLYDRPLTAKLISVTLAIIFSYFVNRHWTYADRSRSGTGRELALFFTINGAAMLIALGTLWMSHYALGLTGPVADNISANVVGLVLGTVFRFWAYRTYVFPELESASEEDFLVAELDASAPIVGSGSVS